jgi:copper chaperone CopZ
MVQPRTVQGKPAIAAVPPSKRARGVLDISGTKLVDPPSFLEEKLRRMQGVIDVEINAFSSRITVEFDPSLITIDKIKASLSKGETDRRPRQSQ